MFGKTVSLKGPLAARLQEIAAKEEMTLEELVDFILRSYLETYGWEDEDDESDEDEDSEE